MRPPDDLTLAIDIQSRSYKLLRWVATAIEKGSCQRRGLFFSTYLFSSIDVIEQPGTRLETRCGCYCPWCSRIVRVSHLQPKKHSRRDKTRAVELIVARVITLAIEEWIPLEPKNATRIVQNEATRRFAGYSAYGCWLINRMEGLTDGRSVLALWREIAWHPTGSPRKNFTLQYRNFVHAEESLVDAMQTALL